MAARALRILLLCGLTWFVSSGSLVANWVASGTFKYQDREFDQNGFTASQPSLPIRFAKVEVRDANKNGGQAVLATTFTNSSGGFSISVTDSNTRTIQFRILTTSETVPGLFLSVTNASGSLSFYALTSPNSPNHNPNVSLNMGTVTALAGVGGEPFNIYDVALNSIDYLAFLNGARPDSSRALALRWQAFSGTTATNFLNNGEIRVGDPSAYNDTVIQHETGHYAREAYSDTDSPGGPHHLTNCNQDLRLAWEEGWATYFGQAVRRFFNLPNPHLYVKTTGQPGPGNLDFYFNVEDEVPFSCDGAASEVTVYATLWDIIDSASTADFTPGTDEAWDFLAAPEAKAWEVMRYYIPTATDRTFEDFWDGWFIRNLGSYNEMRTVFSTHAVEYFEDLQEPNDTPGTAGSTQPNGIPLHATYFRDQGNGVGASDADYFSFGALGGFSYKIETTNLLGDANTSLILYATDGVTQIASNDDRAFLIKSSLITFTAPIDGTYYVKSFHGSGYGIYGSYDLSVTGMSTVAGSAPMPGPAPHLPQIRLIVDGGP